VDDILDVNSVRVVGRMKDEIDNKFAEVEESFDQRYGGWQ
jgi:hypothetical protein